MIRRPVNVIGLPVKLVAGVAPKSKVTVPADLPYIELLLKVRCNARFKIVKAGC